MKSIMVRVREEVHVSVLNIDSVESQDGECVVIVNGRIHKAGCDKATMLKRIDATWEGR